MISRRLGYFYQLFLLIGLSVFLPVFISAKTSEEVAVKIMKSTVRVATLGKSSEVVGHGTGFIISDRGHIATNIHVIEGGVRHMIVYSDGRRVRIREAEIAAASETADLAILWCLPIEDTVPVKLAIAEMAVGQLVSAVGFPSAIDTSNSWATLEGVIQDPNDGDGLIIDAEAKSDFRPAVFPGSVAKLATMNGVRTIFHSAKISPGNSGGPLIDGDGRVCGINTLLIPAERAGTDYPLAIDSRELINLAKIHSISIQESTASASVADAHKGTIVFLTILLIAVLTGVFYLIRRKTGALILQPVSTNVGTPLYPFNRLRSSFSGNQKNGSKKYDMIRLSGVDAEGLSYELSHHLTDIRQAGGRLLIGRKNDPHQFYLPHPSISQQHAVISLNGGSFYLQDLNSANGTEVNGRKILPGKAPTPLQHGYFVKLGKIELLFETL